MTNCRYGLNYLLRSQSRYDEALAACGEALDRHARANLGFALGRSPDSLGLHDRAFAAFDAANPQARRTGPSYSRQRTRRLSDAVVTAFPRDEPPGGGDATRDGTGPVFICGLLRPGSTLLELALAAHPAVTPGGEIDFLARLVRGPLSPFPAAAKGLEAGHLAALADDYRAGLARLFAGAKIIHTVRQPLDNGFSIFTQHLDQRAMPYSSDLADIGGYFGQYRRLMAH